MHCRMPIVAAKRTCTGMNADDQGKYKEETGSEAREENEDSYISSIKLPPRHYDGG